MPPRPKVVFFVNRNGKGSKMDHPRVIEKLNGAVMLGMYKVRAGQGRPTQTILKTADNTFVTPTDKQSEAVMVAALSNIPDTVLHAEESGAGTESARYIIFVDPLDGTGAFANAMMSSTVIAALYDTHTKQVVACSIGEPASGRIWYADHANPTSLTWLNFSHFDPSIPTIVGTEWAERTRELEERDTVFLDVAHGFKDILSHKKMSALLAALPGECRLLIPGSNGLIQALVANGSPRVAGSISTAKGGPFDFVGAYLVQKAGGTCRGFRKDIEQDQFIPHDPLDPVGCDILITANTPDIADELAEIFLRCG